MGLRIRRLEMVGLAIRAVPDSICSIRDFTELDRYDNVTLEIRENMKKSGEGNIKSQMGVVPSSVVSLLWLLFCLWFMGFFSACGSSHSVPKKECCSHTEVKDTSVKDTEVNFDLVKKDGVIIILPTITTDTIK